MSRVPPRRLLALPIEETVTSISCPGLVKAGSVAVSVTAAMFFSCRLVPGGNWMFSCVSMDRSACPVKGVEVVWSPVPSRPTTRP